jgi:ribosomal protein S12 methylthiotransferase
MHAQKKHLARAQAARIGQTVRLLVDGPSEEHELVVRARLESQAPDIDPLVYLTDCDPAELTAGTFIDAEIVGREGYDLLARPRLRHVGSRSDPTNQRWPIGPP